MEKSGRSMKFFVDIPELRAMADTRLAHDIREAAFERVRNFYFDRIFFLGAVIAVTYGWAMMRYSPGNQFFKWWPVQIAVILLGATVYFNFVYWCYRREIRKTVRAILREKGNFCLDCGYLIEGVESGRCPECGRAIES